MPGARLVPLAQVPTLVGDLPTDEPVYLVCAVGAAAGRRPQFLVPARHRRGERRRRHRRLAGGGLPRRALTAPTRERPHDAPDSARV